MANSTPTRGRPKGSGINDQKTLNKITQIISADPSIKPTTAIKLAGITDASTIRRLRDKFKTGDVTNGAAREKSEPAVAKKAATPKKKRAAASSTVAKTKTKTAKAGGVKSKAKAKLQSKVQSKAKSKPKTKPAQTTIRRSKTNGSNGHTNDVHAAPFNFFQPVGQPASDIAGNMQKTMQVMMKSQMKLYESFVSMAPMALMLKQQAAAANMMMSAMKAAPKWPQN